MAKTGPCTNWNSRAVAPSCRMSVPVMSIGIRSGVNWMRLNFSDIVSASLLTCGTTVTRVKFIGDGPGVNDDERPRVVTLGGYE